MRQAAARTRPPSEGGRTALLGMAILGVARPPADAAPHGFRGGACAAGAAPHLAPVSTPLAAPLPPRVSRPPLASESPAPMRYGFRAVRARSVDVARPVPVARFSPLVAGAPTMAADATTRQGPRLLARPLPGPTVPVAGVVRVGPIKAGRAVQGASILGPPRPRLPYGIVRASANPATRQGGPATGAAQVTATPRRTRPALLLTPAGCRGRVTLPVRRVP